MAKIRALVVEDSLTVRKCLVEVLNSDPEIDVVGEAEDGKRAIELCRSLRPDVVTLDMMLPVMSGLAATEYIMAYFPTPILIVSSSVNRGELFRTYDALAAGAVDVLDKPFGDEPSGDWEREFLLKIKIVSRVKVITHPRARLQGRAPGVEADGKTRRFGVVAIGASTGGPAAIVRLVRELPKDYPLPILFVLHLSQMFEAAFADWLSGLSPIPVAYAGDGDPIVKGKILMAPSNRHMAVRKGRIRLTVDPERHSCRPSVDVLFESAAGEFGSGAVACLLTGMGRDGAEGMLAVRRAGGLTIAQDEESSVVFGMPREAILIGGASKVLPLDQIGPALCALAKSS